MPGSSARISITAADMPSALRIAGELPHQRLVGGAADAGLGDEQAAAVETISAGICVTRPSPTVSSV